MRKNDRLYRSIKGGLFHSTSIIGYKGIRERRQILWNDGSFPFSHRQTKCSSCWKLKAISLLDLRNPKVEMPLVGQEAWLNWKIFLTNHDPITVLLEIDPSFLSEPLLDYHALQDVPEGRLTMVAEAEVCYRLPIPLEAICRCVLVCSKVKRPFIFHAVPGADITDNQFGEVQNRFETKLRKIGWREPDHWITHITDACSNIETS
jgi:hypothetical protein